MVCNLQLKSMSRDEYMKLIYGAECPDTSLELQRERTEHKQKERRLMSNTDIIHKVLWRALSAAQRSTTERIRRAGAFLFLLSIFILIFVSINSPPVDCFLAQGYA